MLNLKRNSFVTSDGVKLSYLEGGEGVPFILLHGCSQSAKCFQYVLDDLSKKYHVYALDLRGHGESEKPNFGYRISRLAKDLHDFITTLNLKDIYILGHSMGNSIIWCYIDLFGQQNIAKFIINDNAAMYLEDSSWTEQEKVDSGCTMKPEQLYPTGQSLSGPDYVSIYENMVRAMLTKNASDEDIEWLLEECFKLPPEHGAQLLYTTFTNDWRDLIKRITVPTMVMAGRASNIPWKSQVWINKVIPGSKLEIFEEEEGGGHFTFVENPKKYVQVVSEFLG